MNASIGVYSTLLLCKLDKARNVIATIINRACNEGFRWTLVWDAATSSLIAHFLHGWKLSNSSQLSEEQRKGKRTKKRDMLATLSLGDGYQQTRFVNLQNTRVICCDSSEGLLVMQSDGKVIMSHQCIETRLNPLPPDFWYLNLYYFFTKMQKVIKHDHKCIIVRTLQNISTCCS